MKARQVGRWIKKMKVGQGARNKWINKWLATGLHQLGITPRPWNTAISLAANLPCVDFPCLNHSFRLYSTTKPSIPVEIHAETIEFGHNVLCPSQRAAYSFMQPPAPRLRMNKKKKKYKKWKSTRGQEINKWMKARPVSRWIKKWKKLKNESRPVSQK